MDRVDELHRLLTDVVVAADRMRDHWAEGDDAVKKSLWTKLHTAAEAAYDEVYPLPAERVTGPPVVINVYGRTDG
jgi:hypothetical protein